MSLKYELIKWVIKKSGLKKRGTMSAEEIIAFKKKQNAKISIPKLQDAEITVSQIQVSGFPVITMKHDPKKKKAMLFITGGGMVGAPQPGMVKKALRFAKETGLDVFFPYYPLCTDYPLAKAYDMILATYEKILEEYASENVSLTGLSSGGNLALGMIAHMNATGSKLPKPRYIMAVSPGNGAVTDEERRRLKELDQKDILISAEYITTAEEVMRHGSDSVPDYMIFLQKGDFTDCPKVTFMYGSEEVLYALAPSFDELLKKYGVDHEILVGEGMFHAYPVFPVVKEAKEGWKQMIRLVKENA